MEEVAIASDGVEFLKQGEIATRPPFLSLSSALSYMAIELYWYKIVEQLNEFFLQAWTSAFSAQEQVRQINILGIPLNLKN